MERFDELVAGVRKAFPNDDFFISYETLVIDKVEHYRWLQRCFYALGR